MERKPLWLNLAAIDERERKSEGKKTCLARQKIHETPEKREKQRGFGLFFRVRNSVEREGEGKKEVMTWQKVVYP